MHFYTKNIENGFLRDTSLITNVKILGVPDIKARGVNGRYQRPCLL